MSNKNWQNYLSNQKVIWKAFIADARHLWVLTQNNIDHLTNK